MFLLSAAFYARRIEEICDVGGSAGLRLYNKTTARVAVVRAARRITARVDEASNEQAAYSVCLH